MTVHATMFDKDGEMTGTYTVEEYDTMSIDQYLQVGTIANVTVRMIDGTSCVYERMPNAVQP